MLSFHLTKLNGEIIIPKNILSFEINSEVLAPSDSLRLTFISSKMIKEINEVKIFDNEKLIFNGFCDFLKMDIISEKYRYYIFARSSASILIDNEAKPLEYNNLTAYGLYNLIAKDYGFLCDLPNIYIKNSYVVPKGKSVFGAINDFVNLVSQKNIYVTPQNVIKAFEKSKEAKKVSDFNIHSISYIVNRCDVISDIDYKTESKENYKYHFKSEIAKNKKIIRKRNMNLSFYPLWQRENILKRKIKSSFNNYKNIKLTINNICDIKLFDVFMINEDDILSDENCKDVYIVYEIVKSKGKNGETTQVLLKKEYNEEFLNYVA